MSICAGPGRGDRPSLSLLCPVSPSLFFSPPLSLSRICPLFFVLYFSLSMYVSPTLSISLSLSVSLSLSLSLSVSLCLYVSPSLSLSRCFSLFPSLLSVFVVPLSSRCLTLSLRRRECMSSAVNTSSVRRPMMPAVTYPVHVLRTSNYVQVAALLQSINKIILKKNRYSADCCPARDYVVVSASHVIIITVEVITTVALPRYGITAARRILSPLGRCTNDARAGDGKQQPSRLVIYDPLSGHCHLSCRHRPRQYLRCVGAGLSPCRSLCHDKSKLTTASTDPRDDDRPGVAVLGWHTRTRPKNAAVVCADETGEGSLRRQPFTFF